MTYEEKIAAGLKLYLKEHYAKIGRVVILGDEHERAETDDDQTEEPMEHGDIHPGTA